MDYAVNRAGQALRIRLALPLLNAWQEDSLRLLGLASVNRLTIKDPTKQYALGRAEYNQILNGGATFSNSATARGTYRRLREAAVRPLFRDKRLYVARTDAPNRQMRNEPALIEEIRKRGYDVMTPGSLSFVEQVRLFRSARIVVGPHGAGMTNITFCEPGTIVYELLPTHYLNGCFCNLAHVCDLRYWMDTFESEGDGPPHLRHWESDTVFVLQRLDEIERVDAELLEGEKRQTISAMDFLRGIPGQVSTLEVEPEPASQPSKKVGWMRRSLRALFGRSPRADNR
jgi:capsular polysaccharide biosynthesis protein